MSLQCRLSNFGSCVQSIICKKCISHISSKIPIHVFQSKCGKLEIPKASSEHYLNGLLRRSRRDKNSLSVKCTFIGNSQNFMSRERHKSKRFFLKNLKLTRPPKFQFFKWKLHIKVGDSTHSVEKGKV